MPPFRWIAALLVAALLCLPAAAAGAQTPTQTTPVQGTGSKTPPVQLDGDDGTDGGDTTARSKLPNTGSDPRLLFLVGAALTLLGVGLRLRTADADLY